MMTNDLRYDQGSVLLDDTDDREQESQSFAAIDIFRNTIGRIRDHFFTIEEFQSLERGRLPQNCLRDAMLPDSGQLPGYAARLKSRVLEGLLMDLRDTEDPREIRRAADILCMRQSPRLLKLLTQLYQFNYGSTGLEAALAAVSASGKSRGVMPADGAFVWRFGEEDDKFAEAARAIDEAGGNIARCFQTYRIDWNSPYAKECYLAYLGIADKEGLLNNKRWILVSIEDQEADRLQKLIANYLSTLALIEYNDGVNLAILQKIGQPYISHDWEPYPVALRNKFAEWYYLHQLRIHAFGQPKKLNILGRYFSQVRTSYQVKEDNLLVIDFGEIVVADIGDRPYSFFYQKNAFEKDMALWDKSRENAAELRARQPERQEQLGFAGLTAADEITGAEPEGLCGWDGRFPEPAEDMDQVTIAEALEGQGADEDQALEQGVEGVEGVEEAAGVAVEGAVEDLPSEDEIDLLLTYKDILEDVPEPEEPVIVKTFEERVAEEVENGTYLPAFLRIDRKILTARDFIIEEIEEPCIKLSYEGVDVLYIQEMLDIKMGIEPDMRKKQLAKAMKRKKGGPNPEA